LIQQLNHQIIQSPNTGILSRRAGTGTLEAGKTDWDTKREPARKDGNASRPTIRPPTPVNCQASTLITTRRFWARPALVLFGAIGLSSP
jgi:hypothetical protein